MCSPYDSDGDSLRFDWIADGRLRLKGAFDGDTFVRYTRNSSQVIDYGTPLMPTDTAFVQCIG